MGRGKKPRLPQGTSLLSQAPSSELEVSPGTWLAAAAPHLPRAAGQGLWRRPAGRPRDSATPASAADHRGRREERGEGRVARLPTTPGPGPANVSPPAPTTAGRAPDLTSGERAPSCRPAPSGEPGTRGGRGDLAAKPQRLGCCGAPTRHSPGRRGSPKPVLPSDT